MTLPFFSIGLQCRRRPWMRCVLRKTPFGFCFVRRRRFIVPFYIVPNERKTEWFAKTGSGQTDRLQRKLDRKNGAHLSAGKQSMAVVQAAPCSAGKKTVLLSHLYIKTIILPRQARDKHRESTQKRDDRFLRRCANHASVPCAQARKLISFARHLFIYAKDAIILPRQARDKHRERALKTARDGAFYSCSASLNYSTDMRYAFNLGVRWRPPPPATAADAADADAAAGNDDKQQQQGAEDEDEASAAAESSNASETEGLLVQRRHNSSPRTAAPATTASKETNGATPPPTAAAAAAAATAGGGGLVISEEEIDLDAMITQYRAEQAAAAAAAAAVEGTEGEEIAAEVAVGATGRASGSGGSSVAMRSRRVVAVRMAPLPRALARAALGED